MEKDKMKSKTNWALVYYNLRKPRFPEREPLERINAKIPKYLLEENKKYEDPNRDDEIYVIPRK